jgi:CO dehydrogenase maturation factor
VRVAIAGKGGSGKTTLAGTLARLLARQGRDVLAIDGDTNPNLGQVLGLSADAAAEIGALPSDLLVRREDPGCPSRVIVELAQPVEQVLRTYARAAPDGVRLLVMGRIDHAGAG